MSMFRNVSFLAVSAVTVIAGAANATIVSIDASKDAEVAVSAADTNFGSAGNLGFRFLTSPARNQRSYLSFNLPNDIASIQDASIELFKKDTQTGKTVKLYGVTDETLDSWDETTLTFNNAIAYITHAANEHNPDPAKTTLIGNYGLPNAASTTTTLGDVGENLSSFLEADTNHVATFILVDFDISFAVGSFASKEGTDSGDFAPRLILDYTQVPEPASFVFLATGGLLLMSTRYRNSRASVAKSV